MIGIYVKQVGQGYWDCRLICGKDKDKDAHRLWFLAFFFKVGTDWTTRKPRYRKTLRDSSKLDKQVGRGFLGITEMRQLGAKSGLDDPAGSHDQSRAHIGHGTEQ